MIQEPGKFRRERLVSAIDSQGRGYSSTIFESPRPQ